MSSQKRKRAVSDEAAEMFKGDSEISRLFDDAVGAVDELAKEFAEPEAIRGVTFDSESQLRGIQVQQGEEDEIEEEEEEEEFEKELEYQIGKRKKLKMQNVRRLPLDVRNDLQKLSAAYVDKEIQLATNLATSIVLKYPQAPEPYRILGLIYEEKGDMQRALTLHIIAAQLGRSDSEVWVNLCLVCRECKFPELANLCAARACRASGKNLDAHWLRIACQIESGQEKEKLATLKLMADQWPDNVTVIQELAKAYYQLGNYPKSIETLRKSLLGIDGVSKKIASIDLNLVNMLCEIYHELEKWDDLISLINRVPEESRLLELKVRLATAYAYKGGQDRAKIDPILEELMNQAEPNNYFDLFVSAAHCMVELKDFDYAIQLYDKLTDFGLEQGNSSIFIYLGHIHLLKALQIRNGAPEKTNEINSVLSESLMRFREARKIDKMSPEAALGEGLVLYELKDFQSVRSVLLDGDETEFPNLTNKELVQLKETFEKEPGIQILIGLCRLSEGDVEGFVSKCYERVLHCLIVSVHEKSSRRERQQVMQSLERGRDEYDEINISDASFNRILRELGEDGIRSCATVNERLGSEIFFNIILELGHHLTNLGKSAQAIEIAHLALGCPFFDTKKINDSHIVDQRRTIRMMIVKICMKGGDDERAIISLRKVCKEKPDSIRLWTLYHKISSQYQGVQERYKFISRMTNKNSQSLPLALTLAAHSYETRQYEQALAQYLHLYHYRKSSAYLAMMVALSYLGMSMRRVTKNKLYMATCSFAYFHKYAILNRCSSESIYNLARAYHQLGLLHVAVPLYKAVINPSQTAAALAQKKSYLRTLASFGVDGSGVSYPVSVQIILDELDKPVNVFVPRFNDLRLSREDSFTEEAIFNLSLIYRQSGAMELAKDLLKSLVT